MEIALFVEKAAHQLLGRGAVEAFRQVLALVSAALARRVNQLTDSCELDRIGLGGGRERRVPLQRRRADRNALSIVNVENPGGSLV